MDLALNNLKGWYAIKSNQPTNQPTNQNFQSHLLLLKFLQLIIIGIAVRILFDIVIFIVFCERNVVDKV